MCDLFVLVCVSVCLCVSSFVLSFVRSFVRYFVRLFVRCSFVRSFIDLLSPGWVVVVIIHSDLLLYLLILFKHSK